MLFTKRDIKNIINKITFSSPEIWHRQYTLYRSLPASKINTKKLQELINDRKNIEREVAALKNLPKDMRVGELIGYRCWGVQDNHLYATWFNMQAWKPGVNEACDSYKYDNVGKDRKSDMIVIVYPEASLTGREWPSRMGFHAFKEPGMVNTYIDDCMGSLPPYVAIGSIHMWGDVVEHKKGYRAQYASVRSIDEVVHIKIERDGELLTSLGLVKDAFCEKFLQNLRKTYKVQDL